VPLWEWLLVAGVDTWEWLSEGTWQDTRWSGVCEQGRAYAAKVRTTCFIGCRWEHLPG